MAGVDPLSLGLEGVGIAGNIVSSILGNSARKKEQKALAAQQAELNADKQENQNQYNKDFYSNALDRTENSAAISRANDFFKQRTAQDRKTAAVTGATPEAVQANKQGYGNAYSNLISNIAASGSEAKDRARALYLGQKNTLRNAQTNLTAQQNALLEGKAQQAANLGQNAASLVKAGASSLTTPSLDAKPSVSPKSALNSFNLSTYTDPTTGMKIKV